MNGSQDGSGGGAVGGRRGFEDARDRRNLLERLMDKIPGFRGFQDRELRRDVDKLQREHMAGRVTRLRDEARRLARAYTDAGEIARLKQFERLDQGFDGLSHAVRHADYGNSGLFDSVKIGEPELEKLYAFDLGLMTDLEELERRLDEVPPPGGEDPEPHLHNLVDRLSALRDKWSERDTVVSEVVVTDRP